MSGLRIRSLRYLAALVIVTSSWVASSAQGPFPVFDGMGGYKVGKPDLIAQYGLRPIRIVYASSLWGPGRLPLPLVPTAEDEARIKALAAKLDKEMPGGLVMLDVEHWHTRAAYKDKAPIDENVAKLIKVANWVRAAGPSLKIGYFGVIPADDFNLMKRPKGLEAFASDNARIAKLAPHVDVLFPCLYSVTDNVQEWEAWAKTVLTAAKQFGKPVYPVLWPEYHANVKRLSGQFIPGPFWKTMLDTARAYGDGVVIWSSSPAVGSGGAPWNEEWPWWRVTKEFMARR